MPTETKIAYGAHQSKYAVAFRRQVAIGPTVLNVLSADRNVATFKLVSKAFYAQAGSFAGAKQGVGQGDAVYVTFCSTSTQVDFEEGSRPFARHHSEQNIARAILNNYEGLSFNDYYIKWVYTERRPCHGGRYCQSCDGILASLCFQQENAGNAGVSRWDGRVPGPSFTIYYSFDHDEDASTAITNHLAALGGAPVLSSNVGRAGDCLTMVQRDRLHIDSDLS